MFYRKVFGFSDTCYYIDKDGNKARKQFTEYTEPLQLVSKSVREGMTESQAFRRKAWEYRTYKINEVQGMSFKEWMDLPPHLMEVILNDIRMEVMEINKAREDANKDNGPIQDGPVDPEALLRSRSQALR